MTNLTFNDLGLKETLVKAIDDLGKSAVFHGIENAARVIGNTLAELFIYKSYSRRPFLRFLASIQID